MSLGFGLVRKRLDERLVAARPGSLDLNGALAAFGIDSGS
jgi:hypothetical protein